MEATSERSDTEQKTPMFAVIAAVLLVFCLLTPIILLAFPTMLTIACSIVSLFRREKLRWLAILALVGAALIMASGSRQLSGISSRGTTAADLTSVAVDDWSWDVDPDFGTNGTVKWRAAVRNLTSRPIESVELGFETFDKDGRLLTSRSSYISAIPPNSSRSDESFADYYGTEVKANISVKRVRFSGD